MPKKGHKYKGSPHWLKTNIPEGGIKEQDDAVKTLQTWYGNAPKAPQQEGKENDHGAKVKDKTHVKRKPAISSKPYHKPNTKTQSQAAKRLAGRRI